MTFGSTLGRRCPGSLSMDISRLRDVSYALDYGVIKSGSS
ncbi:hypothetical protein PR003_g31853 [Phytophthora rubi]|uniref:Uncharacterized protein n=1 Tax=Phytophthora rubi TaxID=129364 RepID=A0A6A4B904_9STRA|nr:hypothetical protein PR003_g31853 [Phytophthora rubi]